MSGSWSNNSISSLTIPTDAGTGARITINVNDDGAILVYNAADQLVASIAPTGGTAEDGTVYQEGFEVFQPLAAPSSALLAAAILQFASEFSVIGPSVFGGTLAMAPLGLMLDSGTTAADRTDANLTLQAQGAVDPAVAILKQQYGAFPANEPIIGCALQNDDGGSGAGSRFRRAGLYSATISGAAGLATFAHDCAFTPVYGLFTPLTNFSQGNWSQVFGVNGFTATDAQIVAYTPGGSFCTNGSTVTLMAEFFG